MINPTMTFIGFTGSCLSSLTTFSALCLTAHNEISCRVSDEGYTDMCSANTFGYLKVAAWGAGALAISINILRDEVQRGMR